MIACFMVMLLSLACTLVDNSTPGPGEYQVTVPEVPSASEKPRGVIFSGKRGTQLVLYACPQAPRNNIVTWTPTSRDIDDLEQALPDFMGKQQVPDDYGPLHEYYRQYAGFARGSKKFVCVNFFPYTDIVDTL